MKGPDRLWLRRHSHVDNAASLRKRVADIGKAPVHHDLDAVEMADLIAVADEAYVVGSSVTGRS
jgi:hypothetical protein